MPQQANPSPRSSAALVYIGQVLNITPDAANDFTKRVNRLVEYPGLDLYQVRCHICAIFQGMKPKAAQHLSDENVADLVEERAAGRHLTRVANALSLRPYQAHVQLEEAQEALKRLGLRRAPSIQELAVYVEAHQAYLHKIARQDWRRLGETIARGRSWQALLEEQQRLPGFLLRRARTVPTSAGPSLHMSDAEREFEEQFGDWKTN